MIATKPPPSPAADRLRTLLLFSGLNEETLAVARALDPVLAGEVAADHIDAALGELHSRGRERTALRAAHLARALGLNAAIPSLVRCVESLGDGTALRHAAMVVLAGLGAPAADALLCAFEASRDTVVRCRLAEALVRSSAEGARVRAALVGLLADAPADAAWCLADRSEWRAVPDLLRAFDRLAKHPIADCEGCAFEHLSSIACAVRMLGGNLNRLQQAKVDALAERADVIRVPFANPPSTRSSPNRLAVHAERPGRNDPCPCGSGKKYKRCCARTDPRSVRH